MKRLGQNLLLIFISSLVALLIAEAAVRLFVPKERWQFRDASTDWQPDSLLGWKQKANFKTINYDFDVEPVVFETNADGFRPLTSPEEIDTSDLVVFLVGNSTVNGRHVQERKAVHYYLDSLLRSGGKQARVINASVQGYSTDQALLMISKYARRYKADWILYGFCDNDLGGIMNSTAYSMHKPKFELVGDSLRLIASQYNENFNDYSPPWKLRYIITWSAIYRMIRPLIITVQAKYADPASQILIGAGGASYYFDSEKLNDFDWQLLGALLEKMKDESEEAGARFGFYAHPALESVWLPHIAAAEKKANQKINPFVIEARLQEIATREEIMFIPLADYFRSNQPRGPFHLLPKDTHCNGSGYLMQAEVFSKVISTQ